MEAEELERQVLAALERARSEAGLTVEEMSRRLRPAVRMEDVEGEKRARHLWYAWRRSPRAIPATALLAAAEAAGTSVADLLMEPDAASDLQRQIEDLRRELIASIADLNEELLRVRREAGLAPHAEPPRRASGQSA